MVEQLRQSLEAAAERGTHRGAEEVLRRAEADVRARRRRPLRLAVAGVAAALVLTVAAVGGSFLYARTKLDDVERVEMQAALAGAATTAEPRTVLVVGSDSRAGLEGEDTARFGSIEDVRGARADVVLVLRIDPDAGTAAALSLPRDLLVPIDGGDPQRINTALAAGPDALARTVQLVLGIDLDHYVEVDFEGFRRIIDAVGGVSLRFDEPMRDRGSGFSVDAAGCRELDGEEALALVRSRNLQAEIDGRWRSDPTGDLGRIRRQQQLLLAMVGHATAARNPLTLNRLLDAVSDHVTVDDGLSTDDLLRLARQLGRVDAAGVRFVPIATTAMSWNGAAVLRSTPDDLTAAGAALLGAPAPTMATEPSPVATSVPDPVAC